MPIESEIKVFEDRIVSGQWRVEYFDDDGGVQRAPAMGSWSSSPSEKPVRRTMNGRKCSSVAGPIIPMIGGFPDRCALARSGQIVAPAIKDMNSRRLNVAPQRLGHDPQQLRVE
jgi:hypothetical protein